MPRRRRIAVAALEVHRDICTVEDTSLARAAGAEDLLNVNMLSYYVIQMCLHVKTGDSKS